MKMSDLVAQYIIRMLDETGGNAEIQRNELAGLLGCVPSQINYVITSRFTPEQGYIVESRRGGGGYIRITRVTTDRREAMMHIVSSIGDSLSETTAGHILLTLARQQMIEEYEYNLMSAAVSDKAYACVDQSVRDRLRAAVLKNMLITHIMMK